jgi:uncharacterized protein YjdB
VESGETLTVQSGTLTIPSGNTLTNRGLVYNIGTLANNGTVQTSGMFYNGGTLTNEGTVKNSGSVYDSGTIDNTGGTWSGTSPVAAASSQLTLSTDDDSGNGFDWDYDADGSTLTLTDFKLITTDAYGILFDDTVSGAINVVLVGASTVTGSTNGIFAAEQNAPYPSQSSSLRISGSGTLTAVGGSSGIYANGNSKISGGTLFAKGGKYGICSAQGFVIDGNAIVNAEGGWNGIYNRQYACAIGGDAVVNATGGGAGMSILSYIIISDNAVVTTTGTNGDGIFADTIEIGDNAEMTATGRGRQGIYVGQVCYIYGDAVVTATGVEYGILSFSGYIGIDGDVIVKASGGTGAIELQEIDNPYVSKNLDKGVVFENGTGTVYGDVTLPGDLTVESGETLTISSGSSLTVPSGTTLTNNGKITNNGTLSNNGTINNSDTITGNAITGSGTIINALVKVSKLTIINSASTYTYKAADAVHTILHAVNILPANATVKKVTWKSSNNQLATVNATGLVTFTGKEGTVRITATSPDGPAHYKDIKVVKNVTKLRTPLTTRNLTVKKKISVKPVIDDGSKVITAELTYKSSNPKIATVDANGNVKGIKKGKATITIQSQNGKKATVKINVAKKAVKLKKFTLTGIRKNALTLQKGKTKDLKIKLAQSKASDLKVTFKSSKSSVAKVDAAGRIIAVKKGTATITAKVGSKTVKVKVIVK